MFLIFSLTSLMPKVCVGRLILPLGFSSHNTDLEMRVDDSDEGRRFPSSLSCLKCPNVVSLSSFAPIPLGSKLGAASCEVFPTRSESGGLLGGLPLDKTIPCRNLMNIRDGTVRSLPPLHKSISVFCVEVSCDG